MTSKFVRIGVVTGAVALLLTTLPVRATWIDFSSNLIAYVDRQWGREAPGRLKVLQRMVRDNQIATERGQPDVNAMRQANGFFNQVPYYNDIKLWGVEDYWATPVEMLGAFGGDCEDYSIGKYLSLKHIGVPIEKLRITYVRALRLGVSHMVLAYYPTPDADPLILDNLTNDIRPASQRTDLEPVYSFNDDDLWLSNGNSRKGGASNVRLWRDLLMRLAKEEQM